MCKTDTISSAIGSFFMLVFMVTGGCVGTGWRAAVWNRSAHHPSFTPALSPLSPPPLHPRCRSFIITKTAIPSWWIAAYWSNPWAYITQALAVNEFTGPSWAYPYDASDPDSATMGVTVRGVCARAVRSPARVRSLSQQPRPLACCPHPSFLPP